MDEVLKSRQNESSQVPKPYDCSSMNVDSIVYGIHSMVNCNRDDGSTSNKAFYAGICKDVKENMQRHGNDSYVALIDCGTREKAGSVETELGELGFDVGEITNNGGDDDTTIVYVIQKDRNFKR